MTMWGEQIGSKFDRAGNALAYPGNTVITDLLEDNPAFSVMDKLREMLRNSPLSEHFILLPRESYHMTVIRGLNDLVRTNGYWPDKLPRDMPMREVDAYVARAVAVVPVPGELRMRFGHIMFDDADVRVRLFPVDEQQSRTLTRYRDAVADALGLRLPGHESYRYHLTLAYVLRTVAERDAAALAALQTAMDEVLGNGPGVCLDAPYMAYYHDMLAFYPQPITREMKGDAHVQTKTDR